MCTTCGCSAEARPRVTDLQTGEVVAIGDAVLVLHPNNLDALYLKAQALVGQKEIRERAQAREILELILKLKPDHVEAAALLASVYLAIGPVEKSKPLLESLLAQQPGNQNLQGMYRDLQGRMTQEVTVEETEAGQPEAITDGVAGEIAKPGKRVRKIQRARYPGDVTAFDDLKGSIKEYVLAGAYGGAPFLGEGARGFTMGSCFAGRIARELQRLGQNTFHMQLAETVNTTFSNLEFMRWLTGSPDVAQAAYFEGEMRARNSSREQVLDFLKQADFLVYTLGVAPAFFNRQTGAFSAHSTSDFKQFEFLRDHEYRTSSVGENSANLEQILALARNVNPSLKFVLSVSPVPLSATFEQPSAIVADCVSKSTLRVAAAEFMKGKDEGVIYWPSFEIVRWLGGHIGRVFGTDDGCNHHVGDALVTTIVELFIERFGRPSDKQGA